MGRVKNSEISKAQRLIARVALTAKGRPLFKASNVGHYEIVRVTEGSTQSGLKQGPETSALVEQTVRREAFPSGLAVSVWLKVYTSSGLSGVEI
jgi:hypothetical protein